ncbi:unnamed protein product [Mytilus coruscus]|uniref:Uncharacterized protein n=1 Tax=Mytilus coruscus TaxID=42192 RepID=A0A6J8C0J5_MYTCO|nr:unnamed protein product [Mytilus coruscus]
MGNSQTCVDCNSDVPKQVKWLDNIGGDWGRRFYKWANNETWIKIGSDKYLCSPCLVKRQNQERQKQQNEERRQEEMVLELRRKELMRQEEKRIQDKKRLDEIKQQEMRREEERKKEERRQQERRKEEMRRKENERLQRMQIEEERRREEERQQEIRRQEERRQEEKRRQDKTHREEEKQQKIRREEERRKEERRKEEMRRKEEERQQRRRKDEEKRREEERQQEIRRQEARRQEEKRRQDINRREEERRREMRKEEARRKEERRQQEIRKEEMRQEEIRREELRRVEIKRKAVEQQKLQMEEDRRLMEEKQKEKRRQEEKSRQDKIRRQERRQELKREKERRQEEIRREEETRLEEERQQEARRQEKRRQEEKRIELQRETERQQNEMRKKEEEKLEETRREEERQQEERQKEERRQEERKIQEEIKRQEIREREEAERHIEEKRRREFEFQEEQRKIDEDRLSNWERREKGNIHLVEHSQTIKEFSPTRFFHYFKYNSNPKPEPRTGIEAQKDGSSVLQEMIEKGHITETESKTIGIVLLSVQDKIKNYKYNYHQITQLPDFQLVRRFCSERSCFTCTENEFADCIFEICLAVKLAKTYWPRNTQITSLCLLVKEIQNGILLEINTGEGKTCIIAMFSVFLASCQIPVDIVSSSPILAKRDYEEWKEFYKSLRLPVSCNLIPRKTEERLKCYSGKIVYGTVGSFASDLLRQTFLMENVRGERMCEAVIVDEVDCMLLDQGVHFTYLSHAVPGMHHIEPILFMIWKHIIKHEKIVSENSEHFFLGVLDSLQAVLSSYIDLNDICNETNIPPEIQWLYLFEKNNIFNDGFTNEVLQENNTEYKCVFTIDKLLECLKFVETICQIRFQPYIVLDDNSFREVPWKSISEKQKGKKNTSVGCWGRPFVCPTSI